MAKYAKLLKPLLQLAGVGQQFFFGNRLSRCLGVVKQLQTRTDIIAERNLLG